MSRTGESRRWVAEVRWDDDSTRVVRVGNRPIHHYWPMLSAYFRDVLLPPQRRAEESAVTWTWREPPQLEPIGAAELQAVRRRLESEQQLFAENLTRGRLGEAAERGQVNVQQLGAVMREVVAQLVQRPDAELLAFACRTDQGVRLHSWGATQAAAPYSPDAADLEIAGHVLVGGMPALHDVVLESGDGETLAETPSDTGGRFRFGGLSPGRYRLRARSARRTFPARGLAVELTRASVTNVVLADDDLPAAPRRKGRRRRAGGWPLALTVLLILGVGFGLWHWRGRPAQLAQAGTAARVESPANTPEASPALTKSSARSTAAASPTAPLVSAGGTASSSPATPAGGREGMVRHESLPGSLGVAASALTAPAGATAAPSATSVAASAGATAGTSPSSSLPATANVPPAASTSANPGAAPGSATPTPTLPSATTSAGTPSLAARASPAGQPPTPAASRPESAAATEGAASSVTPTPTEAASPAPVGSGEITAPANALTSSERMRPENALSREVRPAVSDPGRPDGEIDAATHSPPAETIATPSRSPSAPVEPRATLERRLPQLQAQVPLTRTVRVRLGPWRVRVMQDAIVPTQPVPVGDLEPVAVLRQRLLAEQQARAPLSFREPEIRVGLVLTWSASLAGPAPRWISADGGDVVGGQVSSRGAELLWPARTPPEDQLLRLRRDDGVVLAEITLESPGRELVVRTAEDVRARFRVNVKVDSAELAEAAASTEPRFQWRTGSGAPPLAVWPHAAPTSEAPFARLDLPLGATPGAVALQGFGLLDVRTGWALVNDLRQAADRPLRE